MYNYKIKNPERLEKEIDGLLSFSLQKNQIKEFLFEKIISDAKENCEYHSPETLFNEKAKEYGVWFHTVNYLEFKENVARYDTFIIYQCHLDDLRQTVEIILE
ncbi:hypothetical protein KZR47_000986 [Enterococcus faecalis]|uniref:hypothetical protein n=1 Tax=Enterococcus faecalis TaxID=1351 RepID=UPI0001F0C740|nr:hypothetical protein [Enterococcus faecalis]EFT95176.1 hypothetical protein HMPREF9499_00619 [Enterococcus faecalis TX0012]EHU8539406.1 hypothetical protein [Enterococcus faecalis]